MLARNCSVPDVAIVVGGAEKVDTEVAKAMQLCFQAEVRPAFFVTNDKIKTFGHVDHAVTLHPSKMPAWLAVRAARHLSRPGAVWAFRLFDQYPQVTHATGHWQGSSGLFAVKIARELGYEKIILCGVPMTKEGGHFQRRQIWSPAENLRRAWIAHRTELAAYVRSCSGWTQKVFGAVELDWLTGAKSNVAVAVMA